MSGLERGGDWRLPVHVYVSPSESLKGLNVRLDVLSDDVTMTLFPVIAFPSESSQTAWGTPVSPDMTSLILQINEYTSPVIAVPLTKVAIEMAPSGTVSGQQVKLQSINQELHPWELSKGTYRELFK